MKLDVDNGFALKIAVIAVSLIGGYYSLFYKIEKLEADFNRYDRDATMIEFKLLQQQVTGNDVDLSELMKAMNKIMFDVEKIKNRLEITNPN